MLLWRWCKKAGLDPDPAAGSWPRSLYERTSVGLARNLKKINALEEVKDHQCSLQPRPVRPMPRTFEPWRRNGVTVSGSEIFPAKDDIQPSALRTPPFLAQVQPDLLPGVRGSQPAGTALGSPRTSSTTTWSSLSAIWETMPSSNASTSLALRRFGCLRSVEKKDMDNGARGWAAWCPPPHPPHP